jgi:penicillin amidase
MQVDLDGEYWAILPGGNNERYFSEHYDDQLRRWANGEYRDLSRDVEGDLTVEFEEGER